MHEFGGELTGTVDLGALISFGTLDVPTVLGDFHRDYPNVQIRLRQSQTGSMAYLSEIADGSLDLALVSAPHRFPARVHMELLSQEPMVFVCRPDHRLAARDHVAITELTEEALIPRSRRRHRLSDLRRGRHRRNGRKRRTPTRGNSTGTRHRDHRSATTTSTDHTLRSASDRAIHQTPDQ
ncbi:DNA-binding transcriptional LysR family regulator [Mycobacterium frederiksbergense]|uniref:DNA-binding transcriptional LysR family regulator n=1 Tax=Mycolicibacterium frederiksbergense TaxID=117567 RepID=A0ABT6LBB1_9MYCO|nr:DNA-binding transcriptional LysR family regulator [Mycolicibacterium frederiksbergense]